MSRAAFLDKTLVSVANAARQAVFSERFAREGALLQDLDVRIKLITFLFILVVVSLVHRPATLWTLYGASLALALVSRVPLWFFIKRVWLFVPLFSAAIVVPALFNVITPGDPLWVVIKFDSPHTWGPYRLPEHVTVTRQGVWGAFTLVSRVAASVSFAVLFTLTSRWSRVFSGLRSLFVPRVFVMTLGMTERYIAVFLGLIEDMYRARKSRTIRHSGPDHERQWTASRIGFLLKKSVDMSEDVYRAMLSRGFQGDFRSLERFRVTALDAAWTAAVLSAGAGLILCEKGIFLQ